MAFQIGMIGLDRVGAEVDAKLASASRQVVAHISLARSYRTHSALDVTPTVRFENFANCFIIISMLPDDDAVRAHIPHRRTRAPAPARRHSPFDEHDRFQQSLSEVGQWGR